MCQDKSRLHSAILFPNTRHWMPTIRNLPLSMCHPEAEAFMQSPFACNSVAQAEGSAPLLFGGTTSCLCGTGTPACARNRELLRAFPGPAPFLRVGVRVGRWDLVVSFDGLQCLRSVTHSRRKRTRNAFTEVRRKIVEGVAGTCRERRVFASGLDLSSPSSGYWEVCFDSPSN